MANSSKEIKVMPSVRVVPDAPRAPGAAEPSADRGPVDTSRNAAPQQGAGGAAPETAASSLRRIMGSSPVKPATGATVSAIARPPARPIGAGEFPSVRAEAAPAPTTSAPQSLAAAPKGPPQPLVGERPAAQPRTVAPAPRLPEAVPRPLGAPFKPGTPTGSPVPVKGPSVKPVAGPAVVKARHHGILVSFIALVMLPLVIAASYLWLVAVDQYASTVGFSVRTEDTQSSLGLLAGIRSLSGGGSSDADILYDYIHSQELVEALDKEIDLRGIYSAAWPKDPFFAYDPDGSIEDLVDHWKHKVRIDYDTSTGLMTLRVLAFTPEAATIVAERIVALSTQKINDLSLDARADATRYAQEEMDRALERLKDAREALTNFRMRTQVVDPLADLQGQMGIVNSLQAQLAESYVELDLLRVSTTPTDPRITQIEQRIVVIQNRMAEERLKFGKDGKGPGGEDYATTVAEFERLTVDREFAEQTYHVALAAYDAAQAEALRKSRYLATHIQPTIAAKSEYPARWTLLGLTGFFLLMAWSVGVLIYYSVRDRR